MSKKEQIVVSTPALHYDRVHDFWHTNHRSYVCGDHLRIRFNIPETAKRIWIEASRTQWPDRSGLRCRILACHVGCNYRDEFNEETLMWNAIDRLRTLPGLHGDKPETIYICVWYEE